MSSTSMLGGALAVSTCTFLAGVLLTAEAENLGETVVVEELRRKSLIGAVVTGLIVLGGIPTILLDDLTLVEGLLGRALPLVVASAAAGVLTTWQLWRRRYRPARLTAAAAVGLVVAGWGTAQWSWILTDHLRIDDAAGADASLIGLLVAAGLAAVLVAPPLVYLLMLADANRVGTAGPSGSASDFRPDLAQDPNNRTIRG